jgi:nucleoside-diphosphate-sugar epimerase
MPTMPLTPHKGFKRTTRVRLLGANGGRRSARVDPSCPNMAERTPQSSDRSICTTRGMSMKRALVCGAGGFIAGHLVKELKCQGYWVRGVDQKEHEFAATPADEFLLLDLRDAQACESALQLPDGKFDDVYQLAADMGGMGFIHSAECEIMRNSALININMVHAASGSETSRYFFASSVCIYRDMQPGEPELTEDDAYPALPDNEYGWEKLYAERMAMAFARRSGMQVRIARFQNCYGPEGTWDGGREKAPAAICRKVAEVEDGGTIEVWGNGTAVRSYTYVDDMVDGIHRLIQSDLTGPTNIGSSEYVTVAQLVAIVGEVSGKSFDVRYVKGPVGVQSRNFSHARVEGLGWKAQHSLRDGIEKTYPWIEAQVAAKRSRLLS